MNPFFELLDIIISLYVSIVLLRFFLQYFRADYYNPISQFVIKATDPLVRPLRRVIPGYRGLDLSTLLVGWGVMLLKFLLFSMAQLGVVSLLLLSLLALVQSAISLFLFLILVWVIASFVTSAGSYSPYMQVLYQLTEPVLSPFRRWIPPSGGLDFSPMLAGLALIFVRSCIAYYLLPQVVGLGF